MSSQQESKPWVVVRDSQRVGSYPTKELAESAASQLRKQLLEANGGELKMTVVSVVQNLLG